MKEKSDALNQFLQLLFMMAATVIDDQEDVLSLIEQKHSCLDVENLCLEEALGAILIANYTLEKATAAAYHCAKHANHHALCYAVLVTLGSRQPFKTISDAQASRIHYMDGTFVHID